MLSAGEFGQFSVHQIQLSLIKMPVVTDVGRQKYYDDSNIFPLEEAYQSLPITEIPVIISYIGTCVVRLRSSNPQFFYCSSPDTSPLSNQPDWVVIKSTGSLWFLPI